MAGIATRRILRLTSPCLIAVAVFFALGAGPAAAAGETMKPDPGARTRILDQPQFSVFVRAESVTSLIGYQFTLNYNNRSTISGAVGTLTSASSDTALTSAVTTLSAPSPGTTLSSAVNSTTLNAGMFNTTLALAMPTTTLTMAINNSTTSLTLGSTGIISPGATTLTTQLPNGTGTALTLATTDGIYVDDTLRIDSEHMRVMSIDSAMGVTVQRGVQGTTGVSHAAAAPVTIRQTLRIDSEEMSVASVDTVTTATVVRAINGTSIAAHNAAATVLIEPRIAKVASAAGINAGNLIRIDAEELSVVTSNTVNNVLTVTRAQSSTVATAHLSGAVVVKQPSTAEVTTTSPNGAPFVVGGTIQIDQEKMTITAITPGSPGTLTVTRAASGTLPAVHANQTLVVKQPDTIQVTSTAGLSVGNDIVVEGERMTITGIAGPTLTVTRGVGTLPANHPSSSLVVRQPSDFTVASGAGIWPGSVLQIDSEQLGVTAVVGNTVTATRGYNATAVANHSSGALVSLLVLGAGATTVKVNADVIGAPPKDIAIGGGASETRTVTAKSGSGPYTYTLSAATTFPHTAGGSVSVQPSVLALSSAGSLLVGSTIQVDAEQMTVTAINGLNVTVTRGVNGTIPAAHASGAVVTAQVIAAGATSIASVSDIFPNVKLPALLIIDPNTGSEETRTVTAKTGAGAGPYTYTLSAATTYSHAVGVQMQNPALAHYPTYGLRNGAWTQLNANTAAGATSINVRADVLVDTALPAPLLVGYQDAFQEVVTVTGKSGQANGYYTYTISPPAIPQHFAENFVSPAKNTTQPGVPKSFLESTGRTASCPAPTVYTGQINFSCASVDFNCPTPPATTLASATVTGSGQVSVVSDILSGQTLPRGIVLQPDTASAEGVTVTGKSGSGPYTYTLQQPAPPDPAVPALPHAAGSTVYLGGGCVAVNGPNGSGIIATVFFYPGSTPNGVGKGKLEFAPAGAPYQTLLTQYNPSNPSVPIQIVAGAGLAITQGEAQVIRCPDMNNPPAPPPPQITFSDLLKLAQAYGSVGPTQPGGPSANWNPLAELTGDDKVGFADLLIFASVYNQTCP